MEFRNTKLLGTLASCILIDEDTRKNNQAVLDQAITDLNYGGIAINNMPPMIWLNPYLTWGGNEVGKIFVSGYGNFGNVLCYENVEKSIIFSSFMSAGHMMNTNKSVSATMFKNMSHYSLAPTWMKLTKMMAGAITGNFKRKDF